MIYREARLTDIEQMNIVRSSVHENKLSNPALITPEHYMIYLTDRGKGWVCETRNRVVGFAIVDMIDHNVWALFVLPGFEGKGIGKELHDDMLSWYFAHTQSTIWLGTAPATRAEKFYRKAGWKEVGIHGKGEIKFEMTIDMWNNNRLDKI